MRLRGGPWPARAILAILPTGVAGAFAQDHADTARAQWAPVGDQVGAKLPKLAALLDAAEAGNPASPAH